MSSSVLLERRVDNPVRPIDEALRSRIVARLMEENDFSQETAEGILDETLGFLTLCARSNGAFRPSPMVDKGWHAFLLYTMEYAAYCQEIAKRFIHHIPDDDICQNSKKGPKQGPEATVEAMKRLGIPVNEALWPSSAECGGGGCQCQGGAE